MKATCVLIVVLAFTTKCCDTAVCFVVRLVNHGVHHLKSYRLHFTDFTKATKNSVYLTKRKGHGKTSGAGNSEENKTRQNKFLVLGCNLITLKCFLSLLFAK